MSTLFICWATGSVPNEPGLASDLKFMLACETQNLGVPSEAEHTQQSGPEKFSVFTVTTARLPNAPLMPCLDLDMYLSEAHTPQICLHSSVAMSNRR